MANQVDELFVRKCWEDLTGPAHNSLSDLMGAHNKYLADEFLKYTSEQRTVAEYLFKLYSYTAEVDRAKQSERNWRAAVGVALFSSATVFLFEGAKLLNNDSLTGTMSAIGIIGFVSLAIYVAFIHRIKSFWRRVTKEK